MQTWLIDLRSGELGQRLRKEIYLPDYTYLGTLPGVSGCGRRRGGRAFRVGGRQKELALGELDNTQEWISSRCCAWHVGVILGCPVMNQQIKTAWRDGGWRWRIKESGCHIRSARSLFSHLTYTHTYAHTHRQTDERVMDPKPAIAMDRVFVRFSSSFFLRLAGAINASSVSEICSTCLCRLLWQPGPLATY